MFNNNATLPAQGGREWCNNATLPVKGLKRSMDINLDDLPQVIYACFVLHNFCELNKEYINEENIERSITTDRELQPNTATNRFCTDTNEAEGKRVRKVLTKYFDP